MDIKLLDQGNYILYKKSLYMIISRKITPTDFDYLIELHVTGRLLPIMFYKNHYSKEDIIPLGNEVKLRCISSSPACISNGSYIPGISKGKIYTLASCAARTSSYGNTLNYYKLKEIPTRNFSIGRFEVVLPNEHLERVNDYSTYEVVSTTHKCKPTFFSSKKDAEDYAINKSKENKFTYFVRVAISSYKGGYKL